MLTILYLLLCFLQCIHFTCRFDGPCFTRRFANTRHWIRTGYIHIIYLLYKYYEFYTLPDDRFFFFSFLSDKGRSLWIYTRRQSAYNAELDWTLLRSEQGVRELAGLYTMIFYCYCLFLFHFSDNKFSIRWPIATHFGNKCDQSGTFGRSFFDFFWKLPTNDLFPCNSEKKNGSRNL